MEITQKEKDHLERIAMSISDTLGGVKSRVCEEDLRLMYDEERYTDMVGYIKKLFHIPLKIRVGYVNSGGSKTASAWIKHEDLLRLPQFGRFELKFSKVTIYIRKSKINEGSFESFCCTVAHELMHIVLYMTKHDLRFNEVATDVGAMVFGFDSMYTRGRGETKLSFFEYICKPRSWIGLFMRSKRVYLYKGYLTKSYIHHLSLFLEEERKKALA